MDFSRRTRTQLSGESINWITFEARTVKTGASAIQCCYADIERLELSTSTNKAESKNTNVTFRRTQKCIAEEKISLNVSRFLVNPACIAGVMTSRPNFSAR